MKLVICVDGLNKGEAFPVTETATMFIKLFDFNDVLIKLKDQDFCECRYYIHKLLIEGDVNMKFMSIYSDEFSAKSSFNVFLKNVDLYSKLCKEALV